MMLSSSNGSTYVHEDVMFGLEDQHEVEGSRDSKRHTIRERSLSDGVGQENSGGSSNRSREGNVDPRTHTKAVGQFPLTAHVPVDVQADEIRYWMLLWTIAASQRQNLRGNSKQKVHDNQLVWTTVVEPLINRCRFPDRVKVHTYNTSERSE